MRKTAKLTTRGPVNRTGSHSNSGAVNKTNVKKPNNHYPERTEGSKHARELRERTNHIGDKERAGLFERAMQRIYASRIKAAVGAGH